MLCIVSTDSNAGVSKFRENNVFLQGGGSRRLGFDSKGFEHGKCTSVGAILNNLSVGIHLVSLRTVRREWLFTYAMASVGYHGERSQKWLESVK